MRVVIIIRLPSHRDPQCNGVGSVKIPRHNAHHSVGLTVQVQDSFSNIRVAVKMTAPKLFTDYHNVVRSPLLLTGNKGPTDDRLHAKRGKEVLTNNALTRPL